MRIVGAANPINQSLRFGVQRRSGLNSNIDLRLPPEFDLAHFQVPTAFALLGMLSFPRKPAPRALLMSELCPRPTGAYRSPERVLSWSFLTAGLTNTTAELAATMIVARIATPKLRGFVTAMRMTTKYAKAPASRAFRGREIGAATWKAVSGTSARPMSKATSPPL